MKPLIDFIPLLVFFVLYQAFDIFVATGALMAATALQLLVHYALHKRVEKTQGITLLLVLLFGSLTIALHDESFIKWKVTLVYLLFAAGLALSDLLNKSMLKTMLGQEITLPNSAWRTLTWGWVGFFLCCAVANIYIAFHFSLEVWVNFKVFGLLIATFTAMMVTGWYISQKMSDKEK